MGEAAGTESARELGGLAEKCQNGMENLVLNLFTHSGSSERHVQRDASDYRLPGFILGESAAFDRPPEIDDLFFGYGLEEILIWTFIKGADWVHTIHSGLFHAKWLTCWVPRKAI